MRIAYVGNFSQRHCTEVHIALTLEQLGHEVVRIQESTERQVWVQQAFDCDLLLYTRTWGSMVTLSDLQELKQRGIPTASYHLDLYVGLKRVEGLDNDPFWRTDYVFTPDGDSESAKVFAGKNINHHYIKPGVFKDDCYIFGERQPVHVADDVAGNDVVFVGGGVEYGHKEWPYRGDLVRFLEATYGNRYSKFGWPQRTVRNEDLNQLYGQSKVVIGDSVCIDFKHTNYWSDRVYETIGRGGFIIHPFIKGMDEEFTDGENIVFYDYGNFEQLQQKIDFYLENNDERQRIRLAGHQLVKEKATYHNRLQQMLDIVAPSIHQKGVAFGDGEQALMPQTADPIRINLGAGSEPTEGWVNVDWIKAPGIDMVHNLLVFPWPFGDNVAEEIKAIDVLEHMPNFTPAYESMPIAFVEECHRILKPGGTLTIQVPHWNSPNMWIDPTHVRGFDPKSMDYFDPTTDYGTWYGYYSEKKFKVTAELSHTEDGSPNNVTFRMVKI